MRLTEFLSKLQQVKKSGDNYIALCPAHPDRERSLSVREGDKGIVLRCFAGCAPERVVFAMGLEMRDLFDDVAVAQKRKSTGEFARGHSLREIPGQRQAATPILTLRDLAAAKKLPVEFLYDLGVEDHPDGLGVIIGYFDAKGNQHERIRLRTALGKKGWKWLGPAGVKVGVYGEWRLGLADDDADRG